MIHLLYKTLNAALTPDVSIKQYESSFNPIVLSRCWGKQGRLLAHLAEGLNGCAALATPSFTIDEQIIKTNSCKSLTISEQIKFDILY